MSETGLALGPFHMNLDAFKATYLLYELAFHLNETSKSAHRKPIF